MPSRPKLFVSKVNSNLQLLPDGICRQCLLYRLLSLPSISFYYSCLVNNSTTCLPCRLTYYSRYFVRRSMYQSFENIGPSYIPTASYEFCVSSFLHEKHSQPNRGLKSLTVFSLPSNSPKLEIYDCYASRKANTMKTLDASVKVHHSVPNQADSSVVLSDCISMSLNAVMDFSVITKYHEIIVLTSFNKCHCF